MSVFIAGYLISALESKDYSALLLLLIFSIAGVLGETLFSFLWHTFYERKFWSYRVDTLADGYTSLLNFIPWAVGGMFYLNIVGKLTSQYSQPGNFHPFLPFYLVFAVAFLAGLALQVLIFGLILKGRKFKDVSFFNYFFFCFPGVLAIALVAVLYGKIMIALAVGFGLIASAAEYLFGKSVEFFLSKKFWTYNYWAFDNGHFTPLSIIPFALGGFYFWGIALCFGELIRIF